MSMSTDRIPACAEQRTAATLSAWRDGLLDPTDAQRLEQHLAACAACRARVADYDELAAGLRTLQVPAPVGGYGHNPRLRSSSQWTSPPAFLPVAAVSPRLRVAGGLGAVAVVLLLSLAFVQLFSGVRSGVSTGRTPTVLTPNTKPTASASPRASNTPYPLLPPSSLHMINSTTGWAAGAGTDRILRTADGGAHWNDVTPHSARLGNWVTFFLDGNNAWLASSLQPGSPTFDFTVEIYRTADGGRNWLHAGTASADQGWPAALDFVDKQHGWLFLRLAGPARAAFYGTADGGATWSKVSEADTSGAPGHLPLSCLTTALIFLNSSNGWAPGACTASGRPFLYVTHDGGQTWHDAGIQLPAGYSGSCICEIQSLHFSDARTGVFVLSIAVSTGQQAVLYTTNDAGVSWRPGPLLPANAFPVYFIDADHGWALDAKGNTIFSTADGGQHWSTAGTIPSTEVVNDFQFVSSSVGWALGAEPKGDPILKTTDGGQTWTTQLAP